VSGMDYIKFSGDERDSQIVRYGSLNVFQLTRHGTDVNGRSLNKIYVLRRTFVN